MAGTGTSSSGKYTPGQVGAGDGGYGIQGHKGAGGHPPKAIPLNAGRGAQGGPTAAELDIWAHQPNNITANDEFKLEFLPNILDNFDVYTYHFKLFITSLENASQGNVINPANQVIIAESGVSDLTIDKVEINGITGPSIETGTGTQTTLKFEIIEPSGAGLLDKLYYQSVALGIGNWLVMPCFLQLEFRGRDPNTSESSINGAPSALAGQKWIWPIKLTNAKANVTQVGTKYEFDAIMYDELAQSNSYFAIQHNVTLSGLDNFGNAMKELEDKLNADQYEKLIDNYSIPDTFEIVVAPELMNIGIAKASDTKSTAFGADFIDFKKSTAAFTAGTGVDKIVDSILGNSDKYQKLMQGSDTPTSDPKPANASTTQMKKLWRIVTETIPIQYDSLRQDNAVAIKIFIVPYDLGVADVVPSQTGQTPDSIAAEKRRMAEYVKKKIMNKKYNYIFTGLNDQIFNFDLNMNFSFAATLARFGGIYYDSAIKMPGVAVQKKTEDAEKQATETLRNILHFINDTPSDKNLDSKIAEARKSIADSEIDPSLQSRYLTLLDHAKKSQRQSFVPQVTKQGGLSAYGGKGPAPQPQAVYLAEPVSGTNSNGTPVDLRFMSDVDINSSNSKKALDTMNNFKKGKMRAVPFKEGQQESSFSGIDPASNAGRSRVSNVFATALYSTLDASLTSVKLTIKGDPYWLFPRRIGPNQSADLLPRKTIQNILDTSDTDSINPMCSDNFAVIRFRTPRIYNETTGVLDPFTESEMFSGVYKVTSIVSKFEGGKFSQDLNCIIDPVINLTNFLKDMEENAKQLDPVIPPEKSTLPDTAIKTQRITGVGDTIKGQAQTARDAITGAVVDTTSKIYGKVTNSSVSNIPNINRSI